MALAILDLSAGTWEVTHDDSTSVAVGFRSDSPVTAFDNLSFGWTLTVNGVEVATKSYPLEGISYQSSDQQYLSLDIVEVSPDDLCTLAIHASNGGNDYTHEAEWTVARPAKPYESWIWDSENLMWNAPVEIPKDGKMYVWDETSGSWNVVENPIEGV